jgi:hypothetical protein
MYLKRSIHKNWRIFMRTRNQFPDVSLGVTSFFQFKQGLSCFVLVVLKYHSEADVNVQSVGS